MNYDNPSSEQVEKIARKLARAFGEGKLLSLNLESSTMLDKLLDTWEENSYEYWMKKAADILHSL